jgi:putative hemolysin
LRANHFAPEKYRVYPVESCRMTISEDAVDGASSRAALRKLSPILKGYLRAGAMVCGAPAYDAEFGTADVLAILEMEKMAGRYKQHYVVGAEERVN